MSRLLITTRAMRDRRTALGWWAFGVGIYVAMMLAVWPVIDGNEDFEDLADTYPEVLQSMFGGTEGFAAITTPTGFLSTYLFAVIVPVLLTALAATLAGSLVAGEDDKGLLDLLLSHPITRRRVLLEKALAVLASLIVVSLVMVLIIGVGKEPVSLDVGLAGVVAASLGSLLYAALHGALAVLLGAWGLRAGMVQGITWGVVVAGYLLTVMADLVEDLSWLARASPLHHATAGSPLTDGPPSSYLVLVAVTAVLLVVAVVRFDRHDLR